MRILLTYDIATDTTNGRRRLQRIAKFCEANGTRVQDSVFEMTPDPRRLEFIRRTLMNLMNPAEDSIRIYPLAKNEPERLEVLGKREEPRDFLAV